MGSFARNGGTVQKADGGKGPCEERPHPARARHLPPHAGEGNMAVPARGREHGSPPRVAGNMRTTWGFVP